MYNGAVVDSITWRSAAGGRVGEGVPGARLQDRKSKLINYSIKINPISDRHPPDFFRRDQTAEWIMHTGSWSTYLLANDLINSTVLLTPDKYSKFIGQWFFTAAADNTLVPHKTTQFIQTTRFHSQQLHHLLIKYFNNFQICSLTSVHSSSYLPVEPRKRRKIYFACSN